ncbi:N(6)-L-threonylcarbamoyladenine synthase [Theileria orientalis]|uniref:N(6)-L-threonylcarbamoyladenine synthase n=1 Tax=Theileria orientalis TaxID=68886 RepID=A0A976M7N6_THEOR|nr:N(6)-L-threonylcarbamoyladenine synthase [Theileria orientalis]
METSFDDTCVAVVRSDGKILSEGSSSQAHIIEEFGGIKPFTSRDAHMETIESLCDRVIKESGLKMEDINEIAVTRGPGMELCLRVGYNFATELSNKYNIPLVSENHIASHCLSPMITDHQYKHLGSDKQEKSEDLKYPYLALLLSGGHSQIYMVEDPSTFHLMCDTQDQFAGSVLDKCARELGLEIEKGGGPELEKAAKQTNKSQFKFTLPSRTSSYLQFCFSGIQSQLKQAIKTTLKQYKLTTVKDLPREIINQLAYTSQSTLFGKVLDVLDRAMDISRTFFPIRQIVVVGGVSANNTLKNMIFDLLYESDDSVLFEKQKAFLRKVHQIVLRFIKGDRYMLTEDNPYRLMFEKFSRKVKNLEEYIHYLWNPNLIPDLLIPGRLEKVGTKHKNELYKGMIYLYLKQLDMKRLLRIKRSLRWVNKSLSLLEPSKFILQKIRNDRKSPCGTISLESQPNRRWDLYSTSKKYSTDNAVMIGFSLIEKHKMGFRTIKSQERIDGKDEKLGTAV